MVPKQAATINDVATRAGVAVSSVSRALSNHPDVSLRMKERVSEAANFLGYTPNPAAQSLRSGSSKVIGFVVRDFATPFFSEVIRGVEEVLTKAGYTLLITSGSDSEAQESERIATLLHRRVDALLLASSRDHPIALRKIMLNMTKPIVFLDRNHPKATSGSVLFDHATGLKNATEHLIELGHRKIALITGNLDIRPTTERIKGFREAYLSAGVDNSKATEVTGVFSAEFAKAKTTHLMQLPTKDRPTALIAGGTQATIGVLESLSELGIVIGDDLSVIVCDDLPWLRVFTPTISTVARDGETMGRLAAEAVLKQIAGSPPESIMLPVLYFPRQTSRPAPSRAKRI
jgi:LacI family transcriptional regulator